MIDMTQGLFSNPDDGLSIFISNPDGMGVSLPPCLMKKVACIKHRGVGKVNRALVGFLVEKRSRLCPD